MGGRGGSSTSIGSRFLSSLPDYELNHIDNHGYLGNFGTKSSQIEFMRQNGVDDETINQMNDLLRGHGLNQASQASADAAIVSHLENGDAVGRALNMQIEMEEALYNRYMQSHPNADNRVYRRGDRRSGVESWTTNEGGADMGQGGIGWDHQSTISDLRRQGYRILGGMGRHLGSPGESEITMVRWK